MGFVGKLTAIALTLIFSYVLLAKSPTLQYRPLMYRLEHAKGNQTKAESISGRSTGIANDSRLDGPRVVQRLENIGATFTLRAHLHTRMDNRRYFTLPNAAFEAKTGLKLEEMKDYVIKGEIHGAGEFRKVLLRCAARQDVPIYCSSKLSRNIEVGKEYVV